LLVNTITLLTQSAFLQSTGTRSIAGKRSLRNDFAGEAMYNGSVPTTSQ
jgi:hypothetical protein